MSIPFAQEFELSLRAQFRRPQHKLSCGQGKKRQNLRYTCITTNPDGQPASAEASHNTFLYLCLTVCGRDGCHASTSATAPSLLPGDCLRPTNSSRQSGLRKRVPGGCPLLSTAVSVGPGFAPPSAALPSLPADTLAGGELPGFQVPLRQAKAGAASGASGTRSRPRPETAKHRRFSALPSPYFVFTWGGIFTAVHRCPQDQWCTRGRGSRNLSMGRGHNSIKSTDNYFTIVSHALHFCSFRVCTLNDDQQLCNAPEENKINKTVRM